MHIRMLTTGSGMRLCFSCCVKRAMPCSEYYRFQSAVNAFVCATTDLCGKTNQSVMLSALRGQKQQNRSDVGQEPRCTDTTE